MAFGRFGSEFLISSLTGLDQQDVALAASLNGTFGAVFEHEIIVGQSTLDVAHSQLFNADGSRIGATLRVPGAFAGSAIDADIAAMSDGRFVTLQNNVQGTQQPINESLINADGTLAAAGTLVGFSTSTIADNPSLATRSDGLILSVHQTRDVSATNSNIFATLFNANGDDIGLVSDVTPASNNDQHNPDVAALTDGRFVTVYQADNALKARFLSVTIGQTFPLAASGAEIHINGSANNDFRPVVTQLADGGFMVAYYIANTSISGSIYNANGVLQGATFVIADLSANGGVVGDRDIDITTLTNGDVVVAWTGTQGTAGLQSPETATSGTYVDFKVFNPAVLPGQPDFFVTQASGDPRLDGATTVFAGNQFDPALTALADGRFVLAFTDQSGGSQSGGDDASGLALRGQIFDLRTAGVTITGTAGNDQYIGSDFNDVINSGAGKDVIKGGAGKDVLDGLGGVDTADFSDKTLGVVATLNGAVAVNVTIGGVIEDSIRNIENLIGGSAHDTLTGDGLANVLNGGIDVASDTLAGGLGNDTYIINTSSDLITEFVAGGTADVVKASVSFALANDDYIEIMQTTDAALLTAINLTGNGIRQVIIGNAGANILNGGVDFVSDTLVGGLGNDTYIINTSTDLITEFVAGGTADVVQASVSFTLANDDYIETLQTTNAALATAINLTGNSLAQSITGHAGANILNGMFGNDTLTGGLGADTFLFNSTLSAASNRDTITDFNVVADTIQLENTGIFTALGATLGVLDVTMFKNLTTGGAVDATDRILYDDVTGALSYDSDGNGITTAIQFATLTGSPTVTNVDFFVI